MGLISQLFNRKNKEKEEGWNVGGVEDFMTLIRVYYQALMAGNLGVTNLAALPDLRVFKATLKVPTVNNKLGLGEKNRCKKMLQEIYGISDGFFKEIDASVKANCKNVNGMQKYLFQFQGFSQDLLMVMGNLMKWKFRLPSFMKGTLRAMTQKQVNELLTKTDWDDEGVRKAAVSIRHYQSQLGYSAEWMAEYVYNVVLLAKKEPKPDADEKE